MLARLIVVFFLVILARLAQPVFYPPLAALTISGFLKPNGSLK